MGQFSFDIKQWNQLFPFFFLVNEEMEVIALSESLAKLLTAKEQQHFNSLFQIDGPVDTAPDFLVLKGLPSEFFLISSNAATARVQLRGKFAYVEKDHQLLFIGDPIDSVVLSEAILPTASVNGNDVSSADFLQVFEAKNKLEAENKRLLMQIGAERNQFKHFALIAEETVNGGVITDISGKIIWVNKAFERITGFTLKESMGKSPGSMLQGADTNTNTSDYLRAQIKAGKHFECEILNYNKQKKPYWVKISGQPIFDDAGKLIQFFALEEDITERKNAAEKIRQTEERWKFALEGTGAGVWEYNFETEAYFFSNHYEKMLGFSKDELENNTSIWPSLIHPDDRHIVTEYDVEYESGLISNHKKEYRLKCKNGRYIWVMDRGMLISKTNDGKSLRVIGTHTDITDRKRAEERLEKQRYFYEEILNRIPSDIVVFDHEHRYLFINPVAIKDAALRKWMIGKKDEDYCILRNKPLEIVETRRGVFNKVVDSKKLYAWEESMSNIEGESEYHLRNMYPVIDENDEVSMVIGYGVNISERKKIEEQMRINEKRYRDLFNYSQALIYTHDKNGLLLSVNPSFCETLGYTRDELLGKSIKHFMPDYEVANMEQDYLQKVLNEGKVKGVFRVVQKNGTIIYLLFQNYLVEEALMQSYVICFSQDITDRIEAERELKIAKLQTEDISKAKEIFLANMSHEIRTPMNGILGLANLLSKTAMDAQQSNYLKLIQESANNLLVIVNDVLDIEKIASGKIEYELIPFNLFDKLQSTLQSFQYKAEEKGLLLYISSTVADDLILIGDPFRLSQVLNNLLNNALKFTSEGTIVLRISEQERAAEKITIAFAIEDSGIGIDASKLETIFEPFVQATTDTTRKFGGTGLGLSICKKLIVMQGGAISVESKLNSGSVFHFQIPFELGNASMMLKDDIVLDNYQQLANKKILIAEDVELNLFIARQILESWGIQVEVASNGRETIRMVEKDAFDLILMDIQMPEMDGIEATKLIRGMTDATAANTPIIALTANALKGDNHRYLQAGMNDYITKPYTEDKLYSVISKFLMPDANHNNIGIIRHPQEELLEVLAPEAVLASYQEMVEVSSVAKNDFLYDLTMVKTIGKDNPDFLTKMVALFLEQMAEDLANILLLSQSGQWELVSKLAHRMKPSIEGMGINLLVKPIHELEVRVRYSEPISAAELLDLVDFIKIGLEKVFVQLRASFPGGL